MKQIAKYIALITLLILIAPSILFLTDQMPLPAVKTTMLVATIGWFILATIWMWKEPET
ncbi:MAG: hypothetical protein JW860_04040 [Sedimentisphaerales bacterium]|nr:hypothetical protein [Sedimentisphaerales bacterium]